MYLNDFIPFILKLLTNISWFCGGLCLIALLLLNNAPILASEKEPLLVEDYLDKALTFAKNNAIDSCLFYVEKAHPILWQLDKNTWEENIIDIGRQLQRKNVDAALRYFKKHLHFAEQNLAPNHTIIAKLNIRVGYAYKKKSQFYVCLSYYEKALRIFETNQIESNSVAAIYQQAGNIYTRKGDYDKALDYLHKSLNVRLQLKNYPKAANALTDIATVYWDIGELEKSLAYDQRALAQPGISDIQEQRFLINQANVYLALGSFNKAETILQASRTTFEEMDCAESDSKCTRNKYSHLSAIYVDLASIAQHNNNLEQTLSYHQKALTTGLKVYPDEHRSLNKIRVQSAKIHLKQQHYQQALHAFQTALIAMIPNFTDTTLASNPSTKDFNPEPWISRALAGKGDVYRQLYLSNLEQETSKATVLQQALACYQLSLGLSANLHQQHSGETGKFNVAEEVYPIYEKAIHTCLLLNKETHKRAYLDTSFNLIEQSKAATLLQALKNFEAQQYAMIPDSVLTIKTNLEKKITEFTIKVNLDQQQRQYHDSIFKLKRQLSQFNQDLEQSYPQYQNLKYDFELATLKTAQQKLPNEATAIIEYFVGDSSVFVLGITHKQTHFYELPNKIRFDTLARKLQNALTNAPSQMANASERRLAYEDYTQTAHQLYSAILAPILNQLPKNINQLTIIPDDLLGYIPFETFLTTPPKSEEMRYENHQLNYLINNYQINYAYSTTLFIENLDKAVPYYSNDAGLLLGFAPTFDALQNVNTSNTVNLNTCNQQSLSNLTFNGQELSKIATIAKGATFNQQAATKETFIEQAANFPIIHLATHACVDDEEPMYNRIFFTDQPLLTHELYNLRINAELVVLSACNTASGQLQRGEGIMSLSRAFTYAGCPSLVTSLWSVDDEQTSKIMVHFYQNLQQGQAKPDALRNAKLSYLSEQGNELSHPFYWAAFVQIGNTQALQFNKGVAKYWYFLGGFILILGMLGCWGLLRKRRLKAAINN